MKPITQLLIVEKTLSSREESKGQTLSPKEIENIYFEYELENDNYK